MKHKKLYRHQREAEAKALAIDGRCGLFMGVRTGKTRVAIELADRLKVRRVVAVVPLIAVPVWQQQVRLWLPEARTFSCVEQSVTWRAKRLRALCKKRTGRLVFVLVGYESFWRRPLRQAILRYKPQMVIYDEGHRLAHRGTSQSRFAHALASTENKLHTPDYILPLTGTPSPNGHQDVFSIFKAFDPSVFGSSWQVFESEYIKKGGYFGYQIVGYQHVKKLKRLVAQHSYRITTDEALELPEVEDVILSVALTPKTRRAYEELRDEAITQVEDAYGAGTAIGRIVLTNQIRLQQVASGFVRVEEGKRIVELGSEKADALRELLNDRLPEVGRVVVFCRWTHDVVAALRTAGRIVGKDAAFRLDGKVTKQRDLRDVQRGFAKAKRAVLVMQVQKAISIDLSAAHVGVFYSKDWSLLNYEQCRGRLLEHKGKHKVTFYHLISKKTIDRKIQKALAAKEELAHDLWDADRAKEFFGG